MTFRAAAMISLLLILAGCQPNWPTADWSQFIDKKSPLWFVSPAPCGLPFFLNPVPADGFFYEAVGPVPKLTSTWQSDITYVGADGGTRRERFNVLQFWSEVGTRYAPLGLELTHCAVLVEVPSKSRRTPYFFEGNGPAKKAEHEALVTRSVVIWFALVDGFLLAACLCGLGFITVEHRHEKFGTSLAAAVSIAIVAGLAAYMCIEVPWQAFEQAETYQHFVDELPRTPDRLWLLPIWAEGFYYLLKGPPSPVKMQFAFETFAWITGVPAGVWFLLVSPALVRGLFWVLVPLPIQRAHRKAMRKGRRLTKDELVAALNKAVAGRPVWQWKIMACKAERFARRFGYEPSHDT